MQAETTDYLLGAQDKLFVRVYDVRPGTVEVHEWSAVTGQFAVGQSGTLSIPLLGEVPAARKTTSEVAQEIAARLQAKIGLTQRPDASVEVTEYRPIFILGAVSRPNAYPYRPGLRVQQAVALAGGFSRPPDSSVDALERDLMLNRGDLRLLQTERLQLQVRQARLDAQIRGSDTITYPDQVSAHKTEPDVDRAVREEQLLLQTSVDAVRSKKELINQTKTLLNHEVQTLRDKDDSLTRQLSLAQTEMITVSSLVDKGLAVVPRKLAAEQNAAQFTSSKLDVQLAALRAQQDLGRLERDLVDLTSQQQNNALVEAADLRGRLATIEGRIANLSRQVNQTEERLARTTGAATRTPASRIVYTISRLVGDTGPVTMIVNDTDPVMADDTLTVTRPLDPDVEN